MGVAEKIDQRIPLEVYWELEAQSDIKHEYLRGEVVAMAGASVTHNIIVANFLRGLGNKILDKDCTIMASDVKVAIQSSKSFFYPDASVVCGAFEFHEDRKDTITNPKLIMEVLSDSTEAFDRGEKFALYRTLESLQEYALIAQNTTRVDVYSKKGDKVWHMRSYEENEEPINLESLNLSIDLTEIYHKVSFETPS
jgi:Uma2 family endonuclease